MVREKETRSGGGGVKSVCLCVCEENRVLEEGEMREEWDDFF